MKKILLVDDDSELRSLLATYLGRHGYDTLLLPDTRQLDAFLERYQPHLLVLDLMLPGEDGLAACRRLRARSELLPVIMLTARDEPADRVIGRETSNIYDGSKFTADMAVHNFVGDGFRGGTWVSLHNGGGVGWGEVINGGFGMVIDGSKSSEKKIKSMLHWDVNNGIARRSWARNKEAIFAINRAMEENQNLRVTIPNLVDDKVIEDIF